MEWKAYKKTQKARQTKELQNQEKINTKSSKNLFMDDCLLISLAWRVNRIY